MISDLLINLLAGLVLAQSARPLIRAHAGRLVQCAALHVALLFEGLVIWPATLYLYFAHPDWSWMYLVDPRHLPHVVAPATLLADAAALVAGFAAGYSLIRAGKYREVWGALGGVAVLLAALILLTRRRLFHYGSFDEYRAGAHLLALHQVKLGYTLAVVAVGIAAALAYASWQLHLAGRRIS